MKGAASRARSSTPASTPTHRLHQMTLRSPAARGSKAPCIGCRDVIVKGKKTTAKDYDDYDYDCDDYDEHDQHDDYKENMIDADDDEDVSCIANNGHDKAQVNTPSGGLCLVGLYNDGNTCYLNSCIQCLMHTMPFAAAMLSTQAGEYTNKGGRMSGTNLRSSPRRASSTNLGSVVSPARLNDANRLTREFINLMRNMWSASSYSATSAASLLRSLQTWEPQFSGRNQQDAQEAMRAILDGLHQSLNRVKNRIYRDMYKEHESRPEHELADIMWNYHRSLDDSVVQDIFCGQLQSSIECFECGTTSHCFDPFLDLSLPLPENGRMLLTGRNRSLPTNKWRLSIQDCLSLFVEHESLSGRESYKCATCKVPQPSTKKLSIYRAPPILVLHLKRFHNYGGSSRKDHTPISYPLSGLDLTNYLGRTSPSRYPNAALYDLYGVCHHLGDMRGGHYTAQCKSNDGTWHSFNDDTVSPSLESTIVSSTAYILFYQLRNA